jgi:hypothetical protein
VQDAPAVLLSHGERAEDLLPVVARPARLRPPAPVPAKSVLTQLTQSRREEGSPIIDRACVRAAGARPSFASIRDV